MTCPPLIPPGVVISLTMMLISDCQSYSHVKRSMDFHSIPCHLPILSYIIGENLFLEDVMHAGQQYFGVKILVIQKSMK